MFDGVAVALRKLVRNVALILPSHAGQDINDV